MSHEITDRDSLMVSRRLAWHELGTFLPEPVSAADAMVAAGMTWTMGLRELVVKRADGSEIAVPDHKAVINRTTGDVLGVVGDRFEIIQHQALFDLAEACQEAGARINSAGTLKGQTVRWVLAELGADPRRDGDDPMEAYLLITDGTVGNMALSGLPTFVRVECANTLSMAMFGIVPMFKIRHTSSAEDRIEEARQMIAATYTARDAFDDEIEKLLAVEMTKDSFARLVKDELVPEPSSDSKRAETMRSDKVDALIGAWNSPVVVNIDPSGWRAVQAVNTFEQWMTQTRGQTTFEKQAINHIKGQWPLTRKAVELIGA